MWIFSKRDNQRLEAAEIRFLRPLLGFTRLEGRNTDMLEGLQIQNAVEDIRDFQEHFKNNAEKYITRVSTVGLL
jgi:hypothetical protein